MVVVIIKISCLLTLYSAQITPIKQLGKLIVGMSQTEINVNIICETSLLTS